ncbi:hypothetical protein C8F01DRAFT_1139825, partial [Mycena amicta]
MLSDPARVAQMLRTLRLPIPSDYLERIAGTAPTDVKSMAVKWLNGYHAPAGELGRNRRLTLASEIDVTEELLDAQGRLAQAFVITIIDECVSSAVATVDAKGGAGMSTVSLSLNTTFHNPASLGSTLRFISTTMAAAGGASSVWDLREQHLVATAVFSGILSSLKTKAA